MRRPSDAANLQGRVAAQNIVFGNVEEYDGIVGTGICKVFNFTAGGTGLSEKMAKQEGFENIITAIILGNLALYSKNDATGYSKYENNTESAIGYNICLASVNE